MNSKFSSSPSTEKGRTFPGEASSEKEKKSSAFHPFIAIPKRMDE